MRKSALGGVGFGMLFDHGGVNGLEFGAGRFRGGAGSEAAEQLGHAMDAARDHRGGEMMRAGDDVGDDFGFGGIGNRWLEDADDGGGGACRAGRSCR